METFVFFSVNSTNFTKFLEKIAKFLISQIEPKKTPNYNINQLLFYFNDEIILVC